MDAPLRTAYNNQINQNNPLSTPHVTPKDKSVAEGLAISPSKELSSLGSLLETKTITIEKGVVSFEIDLFGSSVPIYPIHHMENVSFDAAFFTKVASHLNNPQSQPAPIIKKESDMLCLEYLFFKSLTLDNSKKDNNIKARRIAELMRDQRPEDASTHLILAYVAFLDYQRGKACSYTQARKLVDTACTLNPNLVEMSLLKMYLARMEGDIREILTLSTSEWRKNPSFPLGEVLCNYSHRLDLICEVIDPEIVTPLEKEFKLLFSQRKYSECLKKINIYIKKNLPNKDGAHYYKIRSLIHLNRIEECEAFLKEVKKDQLALSQILLAAAKKQYAVAYQGFVRYYENQQNQTINFWIILELCDVLRHIQTSISPHLVKLLLLSAEVDPTCYPVKRELFRCALNFCDRAQYPQLSNPIGLLKDLKTFDPEIAHLYDLAYANSRQAEGDSQTSIKVADEIVLAFETYSSNSKFVVSLTNLLKEQGRPERGIEVLKKLYESKYHPDHLQLFANYLEDLKKNDEAMQVLKEHVQKFPDCVLGLRLYASSLQIAGEVAEALTAINQAISLNPRDQKSFILRSELYFNQNEYQKCIDDIEKCDDQSDLIIQASVLVSIERLCICFLELNQLSKIRKLLNKAEYTEHISSNLRHRCLLKIREAQKAKKVAKKCPPAATPLIANPSETEKSVPTIEHMIAVSKVETAPVKASEAEIKREAVRNVVPQAPIHLQRLKNDVTNLDSKAKEKLWVNSPGMLRDACTTDEEIYGISKRPSPTPARLSTKEVFIEQRLTLDEWNRLEVAHQAIIQMGDLLAQEKERCSANPEDPGHFLFPRALAYHVLKFSEALSPTSRNRKEVSEAFKSTIQTHVLSVQLIGSLRHAMRHEFQTVDIDKLKKLVKDLSSSTVKENIRSYRDQAAPKEIKGKESKEVSVAFLDRTKISKKQDIKKTETPDYLEDVQKEFTGMAKVTKKFVDHGALPEVLKDNFYMDGLKMSVCNIEESVKRLGGSSDPELGDIFFFGNRVGHDMGEDPKHYINEEISPPRMLQIIHKAERILSRIKAIAKK